MDRSWKGHAIERVNSQGVYSAMPEEVIQNLSGYVFWSDESEGSVNHFLGLFK